MLGLYLQNIDGATKCIFIELKYGLKLPIFRFFEKGYPTFITIEHNGTESTGLVFQNYKNVIFLSFPYYFMFLSPKYFNILTEFSEFFKVFVKVLVIFQPFF